ncbi:MAG: Arm DNA-binding domain-containing protein [Alphaproteobacteria bacterium]
MQLTDLSCRTSKPTEKNYKLRDGQGLYLLVMKAGGKSWRYDYKLKTGENTYKNGTFVYGLYPEVTLAEAPGTP